MKNAPGHSRGRWAERLGGRRLPEQLQHRLTVAVRGTEHGGAGADQDLRPGEFARFLGEVGVTDDGLARGDVLEPGLQGPDVCLEHVALEGPEPPAQARDLVDRLLEDTAGVREIAAAELVLATGL